MEVTKQTWRVALLGLGLAATTLTGVARAQDAGGNGANPPPPPPPGQNQPGGGQRPGRGNFNPADFLKNYRDQFEGVDLTDDQMKKIDGFLDTAEKNIKSADQGDRQAMGQVFRTLNEDVQSVLTDAQKQTMRQKRQQQMFDRFKQTYTGADLKLSEEQTKKINDVLDDAKKQLSSMTGDDRQKMFQLMRDTREKLNAVLTPEQQKQIPQFGPGGRGGPGGQGRRGNGNGGNGGAPAGGGNGGNNPPPNAQ